MTKSKQKGNPKFQFLFGGEYYNYYMYRVNTEQALLKQQMSTPQNTQMQSATSSIPSLMSGYQPNPMWNNSTTNNSSNTSNQQSSATAQIETITIQQNTLKEQIRQSEQNLQAQHGVIIIIY